MSRTMRRPPRELAADLEARPTLPDVPDRERLRGYAVTGLSFRSGHTLAMRRFPAESVGPGYTSLWHRDRSGRLVIYQDVAPRFSCPRVFGPEVDEAPVVPISLEWTGARRFTMDIDAGATRVHWEVGLAETAVTRLLDTAVAVLPDRVRRSRRFLAVAGPLVGPLLRAGRVRLTGETPSGQEFRADIRRVLVVEESTAVVDGVDLGEPGPLPAQPRLRDFWLPQRGLFAFADALFEPSDPGRHLQLATRRAGWGSAA